ncbi:cytochrome ubiquinol oxidase subunit I [Pseudodesulfovibrio sp.]|uniref:cytochrome ubiquinol oxidase subunit I n=1 Tax=Pseudodesulfovibrio sp. TaxID=2035812 RepID=UPI0026016C9F|nr:cytochrome ubiquinol oxidase subunit I [Pseudodesulfovibrio sp.]MDD3312708.1 cytochrome ubiquinol oxidase subunit I [Pseudodesulfovibrio sp.]
MEYPIWQLTTLGGGFWIALIATLHVYVAHFAVGGGLFLVLSERAAYRTNNIDLLNYTRKHSRFFLLLTMAFGAVSGVAIWFTIALLAPEATITLIHQFVFGWAAEWVCFLGEIVALLIYYYTWDTMDRRDHMTVGWLYFLFGWLSLFLINGIIGFMLTPGDWIRTKDFWDGFFNPTFWPQLVFRTLFSAACAGLFGFVTATRIADDATRVRAVRACALWTVLGVLATIASGWWYVAALPDAQHQLFAGGSHRVAGFLQWFWLFGILTLIGGLGFGLKMPKNVSFPLALVVLAAGLGLFGSFEFLREAARKPYLIWDYTYSNSIQKAMIPVIDQNGALASAKWTPPGLRDGITDENRMEAGRFLFQLECAACHSIGGPMNEIGKRTKMYDADGLEALLTGLGKLNRYMPPFAGDDAEKHALAVYIAEGLNGRKATTADVPEPGVFDPAPFNAESDEYALVAWAASGMQFYAASGKWTLLPPQAVIRAQLVKRDSLPELVNAGVTLSYELEPGTEGDSPTGKLAWREDAGRFEARLAPQACQAGEFQPLPMVTVTARDDQDTVLATARVALPVSNQLACRSCHGGEWARAGSGVSDATVAEILATHDRMNRTDLASRASVACADCHADAAQDAAGLPQLPSLSAAIHGAHAVYLAGRDADRSCLACHPKNTLRGRHDEAGLTCVNCHGSMTGVASALLKGDGAPGSAALLAVVAPSGADKVAPRQPWTMEPDCLTCHEEFGAPGSDDASGRWTKDAAGLFSSRRDDLGAVACAACHGSPHAVHPAANDRDNALPMQLMGEAATLGANGHCPVCHVDAMDDPAHHAGMGLN